MNADKKRRIEYLEGHRDEVVSGFAAVLRDDCLARLEKVMIGFEARNADRGRRGKRPKKKLGFKEIKALVGSLCPSCRANVLKNSRELIS